MSPVATTGLHEGSILSAQCFIAWPFYNQPCLFVSQLLSEHITSADEEQSPIDVATSNQIYGTPSEAVLEMIEHFDPGVPLIVKPQPLGGFVRSAAEQVASA